MSSSKAKKLREQNVVVSLVKDIAAKMTAFEESVEELKILKDSVVELNDTVSKQESENTAILAKLRSDLRENRLKTIADEARALEKVLITSEELKELKDNVISLKKQLADLRQSVDSEVKSKVTQAVENKLEMQRLEHECEKAQLAAENDNYQKQIESLNDYIKRMSNELNSQKDLTASIAAGSRPRETTSKRGDE